MFKKLKICKQCVTIINSTINYICMVKTNVSDEYI